MKSVKVKLAYPTDKPVNFKFGEVNVSVGTTATSIDQHFADKIMEQYPGWIELVVRKTTAKKKVTTKEA